MNRHDEEYTCILTPAEAQGVFIDPAKEPFGSSSDEAALIDKRAEAMRWEDTALKKFIEKNQLGKWAHDAYEAADRAIRSQTDKATANGANGSAMNVNGNGSANGHLVVPSIEGDTEEEDIS